MPGTGTREGHALRDAEEGEAHWALPPEKALGREEQKERADGRPVSGGSRDAERLRPGPGGGLQNQLARLDGGMEAPGEF